MCLATHSLISSQITMATGFDNQSVQVKECSVSVDKAALDALQHAVANHYWFNMILDEIPMWAMYCPTERPCS